MAVRTIIPGPPGTGKTWTLVNKYLANEISSLHTNPKKQFMSHLAMPQQMRLAKE